MHRIAEHSGLLDPKLAIDCHILLAFCKLGQQLTLCCLLWVPRDRCGRFLRFGTFSGSCLWFGLDEPERLFLRLLVRAFLLNNAHVILIIFGSWNTFDSPGLLAAFLVFIQSSCRWDLSRCILHQIDVLLDVAIFALEQGKNGLICRI